jgi:hypothetical protein
LTFLFVLIRIGRENVIKTVLLLERLVLKFGYDVRVHQKVAFLAEEAPPKNRFPTHIAVVIGPSTSSNAQLDRGAKPRLPREDAIQAAARIACYTHSRRHPESTSVAQEGGNRAA